MIPNSEEDYKTQYTARKTVCQMLKDRNLKLVPFANYQTFDSIIDEQFISFQKAYGDSHKWQLLAENKDEKEIVITKSLIQYSSSETKQIQATQKDTNATTIIIITDKPVRNQSQLALKELLPNTLVQFFTSEQLQINISHHFLVPKHEKMSQQQVKQFLEQSHLKKNQLQQMLQSDAMAVYLGLRKGDVVKITRMIDDREYVNYRIVV